MKKLNKILFIDDDEAANFIHQNVTEREGYAEEVVALSSGPDAIEYLSEHKDSLPELIFVDMKMPEMDGFEFISAFEKLVGHMTRGGEKPAVFVAMLTTSILRENEVRTKESDYVKMFITKPLTKNHFEEILSQI